MLPKINCPVSSRQLKLLTSKVDPKSPIQNWLSIASSLPSSFLLSGLAYKEDDSSDQTGSRGKNSGVSQRHGVKRGNEVLANPSSASSGQKSDTNSTAIQPAHKVKGSLAKRPHVLQSSSVESPNDVQDSDDHFVAVEAKLESEDTEHTNEDRLEGNGPDWIPRVRHFLIVA